ncbi:MAG: hypothetical protein EBS69_02705 [Verrucomicrobia bacterium]|nr:hypothetical protein [Verrucomicrobiota bacterium]
MGSAALLEQLYARQFSGQRMRASTLKALMIHTADDLGNPGPDYQYGWGLIHVKAAADVILAHKADTNRPKLIEGTLSRTVSGVKTYTNNYTFVWDGVSPIRATLAWTDPAGSAQTLTDSRTPNLVRNLDLKLALCDAIRWSLDPSLDVTARNSWKEQRGQRGAGIFGIPVRRDVHGLSGIGWNFEQGSRPGLLLDYHRWRGNSGQPRSYGCPDFPGEWSFIPQGHHRSDFRRC